MEKLREVRKRYEKLLLNDELPFWLEKAVDWKNGGIYTGHDRKGNIIETDKSVWFQGRSIWTFCKAYEKYQNEEYLKAAENILSFLEKYCFDSDGRMFFRVTEKGEPVIKRERYFFSETFAIIAFAIYSRVTGKNEYREKALKLLEFVEKIRSTKGILKPKFNQDVEPYISFGPPMILLNVLSELRLSYPEKSDWINSYMDRLLNEVETYFVRDDMKLVLESCAPDGRFVSDHFEGRLLNPGHAIESAWFIMNDGVERNRKDLINLGLKILDWEWELGWDSEYGGGIIQYRDALNKPLFEYNQDMKFWWPQCEASIANLLAYSLTKNQKYLDRFYMVDKYIFERFHDDEYGEWFGYFHRDGTRATDIKGNMYKGPFHVPRMYMKCIDIIDSIENGEQNEETDSRP